MIKDERIWNTYRGYGKSIYVLTTKKGSREWYYLYQVDGDKETKLGKARTPLELEEKFLR